MNRQEVKHLVKDLLDKIKKIKGKPGMLILKNKNYTKEELDLIRKELQDYLDKIK